MADVRMYPIRPYPDVDDAVAFYEALGFTRTYHQQRPNPHAVVARGDLRLHLSGIAGFDPTGSYASVIVVVSDTDELYRAFADGLRKSYGRLPVSGIPRITRPRKRYGTVAGFSLVDVGGNWLRVSRAGDTEETADGADAGLGRIVEVAVRLADARGDEAAALKTLESGLSRYPDAPAIERTRALLYRAELAVRLEDSGLARSSLAEIREVELGKAERRLVAEELDHVTRLVEGG
jgi:hypothetical protein